MLKLMFAYLAHKNWRSRLMMNQPASAIFTCWILSLLFFVGGVLGAAVGTIDVNSTLGMAVAALLLFAISFAFVTEAKRIHAMRVLAKSPVFSAD